MKKILLFSIILLSICAKAQVSGFTFNTSGSLPAGFSQALTIAGQNWTNYLQITVPIKVNIITVNSNLYPFSAITLTNGRQNFTNAPVPNTLYTTSLANQIAGVELNPGEYDMDIYVNLATPFYFGTAQPTPSKYDFISIAMHEIGHGLGFYSDGYVDGNGLGSFGNIPASTISPLTSSFPWPGQEGVPAIFDKFIVKASNSPLTTIAPQNSLALGDSIKNGAMYFNGPVYANASHGNAPIRLSGGAGTFGIGTDLLHIHNTYDSTIMSYFWGPGDVMRVPGPWELGILKEIGWNLKPVGVYENHNADDVVTYPNPASANVFVDAANVTEVKMYTLHGELVQSVINHSARKELTINVENLNDGIYFLQIAFEDGKPSVMRKVVIGQMN
ncbi:MAG: T9SS type A sorting domain-containing protein [Bacteroidota bacterium]